MKKFIISAILTISIVSVVFAFGGKSGDKNATGQITSMVVQAPICTVKGRTEGGSLWLGYTVYWNDGHEQDYTPEKVSGNFSKSFAFNVIDHPQGLRKVTVALWRYKVSSSKCAEEHGGKACVYCVRNGYHMEGRIDSRTSN